MRATKDITTRDGNWMVYATELDEDEVEHVTVIGDAEPGEEVLHFMEEADTGRYVTKMVVGADTLLSIIQEFAKKGETDAAAS